MTRRAQHCVPQAVKRVLSDAQDRLTISMALSNGATVTPFGSTCHLRLPGQDRAQAFPAALVEDVQRGIRGAAEGDEYPAHSADVGR
jgi:hypothetical protein